MKRYLIFTAIFFLASTCLAQEASLLSSIRQDSALDLYLTLDWKHLFRHKMEKAYVPAQVVLIINDTDTLSFQAKVRTRGHMRLDICSFPPLKLKLEKSGLDRYGLSSMNELDIVHHCHDSRDHEQFLLREYLAYKLWEMVSPYYFKVQLLKIHYLDEDGTEAFESSYAFFVENTEELVERLGARRYKTAVISQNAVDKIPMLRVALFEYMIGNTDWFIQNRHNLEFIGMPGHKLLVPIPFDFDYSGLVNAPYAVHHTSLDLPSVDIRYYQGWCQSEEEVKQELKPFIDQKQNLTSLPYKIEGLNEKSLQYINSYLHEFFLIIENPKKLENLVLEHCNMWPVKN